MQQFDLSLWIKDKSRKVVTRDGREVEILKTNRKDGVHPIIFTVLDQNGIEQIHFCNKVGICTTLTSPNKFDLFFGEEPEIIDVPFGAKDSEFIKDEYFIPEGCEAKIEGNKVIIEKTQKEELSEFEKKLVEILKSEGAPIGNIEKFTDKDKEAFHCYSKQLLDLAKKEILKDLPKWKKATEHKDLEKHIAILEDGKVLLSNYLEKGDYYIDLEDLKTLPKEE